MGYGFLREFPSGVFARALPFINKATFSLIGIFTFKAQTFYFVWGMHCTVVMFADNFFGCFGESQSVRLKCWLD